MLYLFLALYIAIGTTVNKYWYQKKLENLEKQLRKDRNDQTLEFNQVREGLWTFLMIILPLFVVIYEKKTRFRQWTYPFCSPEWNEMSKEAKMQFLLQ